MQLLGHKDIRMTLRYVEVTQLDLQREFHTAHQRAASPIGCPYSRFPTPPPPTSPASVRRWQPPAISWRCTGRGLPDEKTRRRLQRLDRRLLDVAAQLDRITTAEK
jgi:hypothetical protein